MFQFFKSKGIKTMTKQITVPVTPEQVVIFRCLIYSGGDDARDARKAFFTMLGLDRDKEFELHHNSKCDLVAITGYALETKPPVCAQTSDEKREHEERVANLKARADEARKADEKREEERLAELNFRVDAWNKLESAMRSFSVNARNQSILNSAREKMEVEIEKPSTLIPLFDSIGQVIGNVVNFKSDGKGKVFATMVFKSGD